MDFEQRITPGGIALDEYDENGLLTHEYVVHPCPDDYVLEARGGRLRLRHRGSTVWLAGELFDSFGDGKMARLLYVTNMSLDGYIEDEDGKFDFTEPGDDFFEFVTDLVRPVGTYLYGRRLYEAMAVWETEPDLASRSALMGDFANVWQTADKVVYSKTLDSVRTSNTRLQRSFEPSEVRGLKDSATDDLMIGGAEMAAHAFRADLVDDCHLIVHPILVGGGKQAFPSGARSHFDLLANRSFRNGAIHLHYRVRR